MNGKTPAQATTAHIVMASHYLTLALEHVTSAAKLNPYGNVLDLTANNIGYAVNDLDSMIPDSV